MRKTGQKPVTPADALERLEALCASAERCTSELRMKLRRWQVPSADADRIIESLAKRRFVDDERFARVFVRDRYRHMRWGRMKIKAALYAKRIPGWLIEEALTEIDDTHYESALRVVLRAKATSLGEEARTYDGRTKMFRHAASRGYELSLIASIIKDAAFWQALDCPN